MSNKIKYVFKVKTMSHTITAKEYLCLSDAAYASDTGQSPSDRIQEEFRDAYAVLEHERDYTVFQKKATGEVIISVKGTDFKNVFDLGADTFVAADQVGNIPRTKIVSDVTEKYMKQYLDVTVTGHSLGGSIAAYVAKHHDILAVVFAMGETPLKNFSNILETREEQSDEYRHVVNFIFRYDPISASSVTAETFHTFVVGDSANHSLEGFYDVDFDSVVDSENRKARDIIQSYGTNIRNVRADDKYDIYYTKEEPSMWSKYAESARNGWDVVTGTGAVYVVFLKLAQKVREFSGNIRSLGDAPAPEAVAEVQVQAEAGVENIIAEGREAVNALEGAQQSRAFRLLRRGLRALEDPGAAVRNAASRGGRYVWQRLADAIRRRLQPDNVELTELNLPEDNPFSIEEELDMSDHVFDEMGMFSSDEEEEFEQNQEEGEEAEAPEGGDLEEEPPLDDVQPGAFDEEPLFPNEPTESQLDEVKDLDEFLTEAEGNNAAEVGGEIGEEFDDFGLMEDVALDGEFAESLEEVAVSESSALLGGEAAAEGVAAVVGGMVAAAVALPVLAVGSAIYFAVQRNQRSYELKQAIQRLDREYDEKLRVAALAAKVEIPTERLQVPYKELGVFGMNKMGGQMYSNRDMYGEAALVYLKWRADNPEMFYIGKHGALTELGKIFRGTVGPGFPLVYPRTGNNGDSNYIVTDSNTKPKMIDVVRKIIEADRRTNPNSKYPSSLDLGFDEFTFVHMYDLFCKVNAEMHKPTFKYFLNDFISKRHARHKFTEMSPDTQNHFLQQLFNLLSPAYQDYFEMMINLRSHVLRVKHQLVGGATIENIDEVLSAMDKLKLYMVALMTKHQKNAEETLRQFEKTHSLPVVFKGIEKVLNILRVQNGFMYLRNIGYDLTQFQTYFSVGTTSLLSDPPRSVAEQQAADAILQDQMRKDNTDFQTFYGEGNKPRGDRETYEEFMERFARWKKQKAIDATMNTHKPIDEAVGTAPGAEGQTEEEPGEAVYCEYIRPKKKSKLTVDPLN